MLSSSYLAQLYKRNLTCKCKIALASVKQAAGNQDLDSVISGMIFLELLNISAPPSA